MSPFDKLRGRQLMLCDMLYQGPSKKTNWKDYLNITYRDLLTDEKELMIIEEPMITIYEVKNEYRTFKRQRNYMLEEKLIPHEIKYKNRLLEIAKIGGKEYVDYYNEHKTNKERKQLYKYPYVLGADIDIEVYYRTMWMNELDNDARKETRPVFLDIEADQKEWDGPIARHGECPINAVSIVDSCSKTVHQFLLVYDAIPEIREFIKPENQKEYQRTLHEMFDEPYGVLDYKIYAFESEIELIRQIFILINSIKRDFLLVWNMGYDIPYIIGRIEALGYNPADIMCHSDFPSTTLFYYEDNNTFEFSAKRDYFEISSYTHYLDQLIMYASLRKSQGAMRKVNLGAIGQKEIGDTKLDYTDVGNFIMFPYENYPMFATYNVKDTLLQYGINMKCNDVNTYYLSCYNSLCGYKDGLKQTVSLRALIYKELRDKKMVLGHNVNFDNKSNRSDDDEDDDKFEGAINGDPMLNDYTGLTLFGKDSMYLFGGCIDFDFSAELTRPKTARAVGQTSLIAGTFLYMNLCRTYRNICSLGHNYQPRMVTV